MAPTKKQKAILKAKNANEAKAIVEKLMLSSKKKTTGESSSVSGNSTEINKTIRTASLKAKSGTKATNVVAKLRKSTRKIQKAQKNGRPSSELDSKNVDDATKAELKSVEFSGEIDDASTSNADNSQGVDLTLNPPESDGKYVYEIDCQRVGCHVNVTDLQKYLQGQLKVNGSENNISIACQEQKIVIKSKVFLPKRSLRFLSKNFLEKEWNIQVVSKSTCVYEFKYVGTP